MRYLKQLLSFVVVSFVASSLATAAAPEAKVVKVSGDARVQLPGQSSPVQVTEGMLLPQGSTITTANGEVWLSGFPGATAAVHPNSSVNLSELGTNSDGKRKALLELTRGKITSTLDPSKSGVTNYSVRTPKGVAAARGTAFEVIFAQSATTGEGEMTTVTLSGTVTVTLHMADDKVVTLSLPVGNAVTSGGGSAELNGTSVTIAEALSNGTISAEDLKQAVLAVVGAVTGGGNGYSDATGQALIKAAVGASVAAVGANSADATAIIDAARNAVGSNSALSGAVDAGATAGGQNSNSGDSTNSDQKSGQITPSTGSQEQGKDIDQTKSIVTSPSH